LSLKKIEILIKQQLPVFVRLEQELENREFFRNRKIFFPFVF